MGTISSDRSETFRYIACFDLDMTLIRAISGKEIVLAAIKQGLIKWIDIIKALYLFFAYKTCMEDPLSIINKMAGWLKGISAESIDSLCTMVARDVLVPAVYRDARTEIEKHKIHGAEMIILSSSIVPVCREIAGHLKFDEIICSEIETANGYCTGRLKGSLCFGEEKITRLRNYCEKNNNKLSEVWYYGDSLSDLPVMNSVGHPVCINPGKKLMRKAMDYNWEIKHWH